MSGDVIMFEKFDNNYLKLLLLIELKTILASNL